MCRSVVLTIIHYLQEAYIDGLDGEEFYQSLFDEDTEADKLILFPEQEEKMESYVCIGPPFHASLT